jgi:serine/threonine protein kinase
VDDLLRECTKMQEFNHPNVLTLIGVCLDGGPTPYIVMPFMSSGSLLSYLKENRKTLVVLDLSLDPEDMVSYSCF